MRYLGDKYVKSEFRQHVDADPHFVAQFMNTWRIYAEKLEEQTTSGGKVRIARREPFALFRVFASVTYVYRQLCMMMDSSYGEQLCFPCRWPTLIMLPFDCDFGTSNVLLTGALLSFAARLQHG